MRLVRLKRDHRYREFRSRLELWKSQMETKDKEPKLTEAIQAVMKRYEQYTRYLNYPGEWGERAFRGWIVYELFHIRFRWPIKNIVFGERYDVLFVDDNIKPMIYLETKKPGRGLADFDDFRDRISAYQTMQHAVLANGYEWLRIDVAKDTQEVITLEDSDSKWNEFAKPLKAKNYLYGVWK